MDPSSLRPVTSVPTTLYKVFRWNKWRKARRRGLQLFLTESIERAMFPQAHESYEAQYTARTLWQIMQRVEIPGEEPPSGPIGQRRQRANDILYGLFPHFHVSAIGLRKRLSLWIAKALFSDKGRELLETVDMGPMSWDDCKSVGALAAELFMQRLDVGRYNDPDVERVRGWVREEFRKNESDALALGRRTENEVTRTVEVSSALAALTGVSYLLDNLGLHGVYAVLIGGSAAVFTYFGSRIAFRTRPLSPRQIGFRLYCLAAVSTFLSTILGSKVENTVPAVRSALEHVRNFQVWHRLELEKSTDNLPANPDSPEGDNTEEPVDVFVLGNQSETVRVAIAELHSAVERANDLAGGVNDPGVQNALLQLETSARNATSAGALHEPILRLVDSLTH